MLVKKIDTNLRFILYKRDYGLKLLVILILFAHCPRLLLAEPAKSNFHILQSQVHHYNERASNQMFLSHDQSYFKRKFATWILDKTINNVECYYMITTCNDQKVVVLKFDNKNAFSVKISWKGIFNTQFEQNIEGSFGQRQLTLLSGETLSSDCSGNICRKCLIEPVDVKPTYVVQIQKFQYGEISVEKL